MLFCVGCELKNVAASFRNVGISLIPNQIKTPIHHIPLETARCLFDLEALIDLPDVPCQDEPDEANDLATRCETMSRVCFLTGTKPALSLPSVCVTEIPKSESAFLAKSNLTNLPSANRFTFKT
jgi:hypothetical protein